MTNNTRLVSLLVGWAVLLSACVSTTLHSVWKDPQLGSAPLQNTVVIGAFNQETMRRLFEDQFVSEFQAKGRKAQPSYPLFSDGAKLTKEELIAKVQQAGADTVLLSRLVEKKTIDTYVPGSAAGTDMFMSYSHGYNQMVTPGYVTSDEVAVVETLLYDAASGKLLWSGVSDTVIDAASNKAQVKPAVAIIAKKLFEDHSAH